ncbi:MAG: GLUG motif-containing protein [Sedimentibacter sp.]
MKHKKRIAILLTIAMIISMIQLPAFAQETKSFSDMPENWSTQALQNAVSNGLLNGYNGKISPNDYLTRAQMAAVVNRAFNATEKAPLKNFNDVTVSSWYYEHMEIALKMKTFMGNGHGFLEPENNITREEAFVVLARAFKISGEAESALDGFSDKDMVSSWAKDSLASLVKAGYIAGSNGKLNPKLNIIRAEFAKLMDNLLKQYIKTSGTYTQVVSGNVMINVPGVTMKDVVINGDLIIGDGVGDGDVTFDNVEVAGRVLVRGGGINSIIIKGNSKIHKIIVARVDGEVRIYAQDGTEVGTFIADGLDNVLIEGKFQSVIILAPNITVTAVAASINSALIEGDNSVLIVKGNSYVKKVSVNGSGVTIKGDGKVDEVMANGNNITVDTINTSVTASSDSSNIKAYGKTVAPGKTVVTRRNTSSSSSSTSVTLYAASPSASPVAGQVTSGTAVTLTTTTADATIYYTKDGSTPTIGSTIYTEPIIISGDVTIKAITVKSGMNNSSVLSATYTILITIPSDFAGGSGTEQDPYKVATATQLSNVRNYLDKHFIQIADIDLGTSTWSDGEGWEPLGDFTNKFTGSYDGDGYTIDNLTINRDEMYQGLFAYLSNGLIDNVKLISAYIEGGMWTGGIVAFQSGGSILNCSLEGVVKGLGNHGGLVGQSSGPDALIDGCYTTGEVSTLESTGTLNYVGGLVGRTANSSVISNSFSSSDVSGDNTVGGLVGLVFNSSIEKSYALGDVSGSTKLGGIVGWANGTSDSGTTIEDIYYQGKITSSGDTLVGGVAGFGSYTTVENGYFIAEKSVYNEYNPYYGLFGNYDENTQFNEIYIASTHSADQTYISLYERTIGDLKKLSTYKNFDFKYTWGHNADENDGFPFLKWQGYEHISDFAGGSGTVDDPYEVETVEQLNLVRNYLEKNFIQIEDIDMTDYLSVDGEGYNAGEGWTPIASYYSDGQKMFLGTYDGDDFTITGLTINRLSKQYMGLFGRLGEDSVLTNIKLKDASITGDSSIGALAGYCMGDTINCSSVNGYIHGTGSDVGGLVGEFFGDMDDCSVTGTVIGDYSRVGGLIGDLYSSDNSSRVTDSYNEADVFGGDINGTWADAYSVGGIIGECSGSTVENCYSTGDIYGNEEVGGLIGSNDDGIIKNCYSVGDIYGLVDSDNDWGYYIGGLVGENTYDNEIINCEARGKISAAGADEVGGLVGANGSSIIRNSGYTGDSVIGFDTVGGLAGDSDYSTISNAYVATSVAGNEYVGGLIGYSENDDITESYTKCTVSSTSVEYEFGGFIGGGSNMTISDCYSQSSVSGHKEVGGFIGYVGIGTNTITNCYVVGSVSKAFSSSSQLGNFIGNLSTQAGVVTTITNCYYDSDVATQPDNSIGVPMTTEEMTDKSNFTGWNFTENTGIWAIDTDPASYPYFQWQIK